jgi:hypothetical protein
MATSKIFWTLDTGAWPRLRSRWRRVARLEEDHMVRSALFAGVLGSLFVAGSTVAETADGPLFHDSHFHLTNYVQEGPSATRFLEIMGDRVGRSTLFGIPLQQTWSFENTGEFAPTYYLHSDAPLYYYSFTDAWIALQYRSLPPAQQARFEPMITGFNPSDMYAADHIRRVLLAFPGVFSGIGEFTIHKEFVSSKVAGNNATLSDPALDRVLDLAGEAGLVVVLHSDIDIPFAKADAEPVYLTQMKELLRRHPDTTIVWAHTGLGRVVHPPTSQASSDGTAERSPRHLDYLEGILEDRKLRHVHFDISWDEVAKYVVASPETVTRVARLIDRFPDRFLFGTDNVAPPDQNTHLAVYRMYEPLWTALNAETSHALRLGNFERLFDRARVKVRAWEKDNAR